MNTSDSQIVEAEIARLSGLKFRTLSLPSDLEEAFEKDTRAGRCKRLWLEGLLALFIFNLVLFAGQRSHPSPDILRVILKLYLFSPLALLVNLCMLLRPGARLRETSIAAVAIALGVSVLALELHRGIENALLAQFGLAIVLIFSHTVMRLRFGYAVAVSVSLACAEGLFATFDRSQSANIRALGFFFTFATLIFTAIANYSHNRQERVGFLLCLRGDFLIKQLNQEKNSLALAAEQDALTGLANRRAFDRRLEEAWNESVELGLVLAIILIDIDHFKRLNDTFGHLFGDKVLRRVGRLLQESLRKKADSAARFGGEEFVILLPGTALDKALIVAERLRNLVQVAGLPALDDGSPMKNVYAATVSCGVAAGSPMQFHSLRDFVDAADRALYRAKAAGRNCICATQAPSALPTQADITAQVQSAPSGHFVS